MEYKKYECDAYNIYTIKAEQFKNCHIEVIYRNKIDKDMITKRTLLADVLMESCKKYPTKKDLMIEFEELYNSYIYAVTSRVGECLFTNFCLSFLNPKYTEKDLPKKTIRLLFEMIQNPNIENDAFDEESFNNAKNALKAEIISQKENVVGYAFRRMMYNLDKESVSSIVPSGYLEDLEDITNESLVETYDEAIKSDVCDIFVIGDLDMDEIVKIINDNFKNRVIKTKKLNLYVDNKVRKKPQEVSEYENFSQANLVVGCNISNLTKKEKSIVAKIYNVILGEGSLQTKLGKLLRSENSMCYVVNSIYQKFDQLILIYAGIDKENYKQAVKLIQKALKEMKDGKITDTEFNDAKKLLLSSLEMSYDNPVTILNNYVFQVFDNQLDIDSLIKELKKVKLEEVVNLAKKVQLNTIYLLSDGGNNNEGN